MKKISLLTTILVSFVMVAFLVLSISIKSNNSSRFSDDGFVISSNLDESSVNRFSSDTTYNMLNNNAVSFKTTDGVKAVVNNNSFIHYADGSISAMKDGVMLELTPEITSGLSSAYFVPAKTTLLKNGNSYTVEGMTSVSLENLIYKLNHNKYLVCSSNMELNLPNNNLIKIKDFLEITYVDNGIVLLSDGDNTWTSVSLDSSLTLENGLNINFMTREIKYDKEVVLQLNRLLVNEDDSVEVLPFQDGSFTIPKISIEGINGKKGEDGKDGEDGIDGARGASGSGGANGTDGEDGEQFSDALELPVFRLNDFEVSNVSVSFSIPIPEFTTLLTSPDGLEEAKAQIRIYDNETNKLVSYDDWNIGQAYESNDTFDNVLMPNKSYKLTLNSEYFINGQKLTRDFITKVFHTANQDLDFELAYAKEDEITIEITKPLGVSVGSSSLYIFNSASEANQYIYDINNSPSHSSSISPLSLPISFGDTQTKTIVNFKEIKVGVNLKPDTSYAFALGNTKMSSKIVEAKTLKRTPVMVGAELGGVPPKPVVVENMKIYGFDLFVPKFNDPDNSLVKMNWKIYHRNTDDGNKELVKTITLPFDQNTPTNLFIDDEVIKKDEQYVASLEVIYNDNNKDVTVNVGESKVFRMDNKRLPIVRFVQAEDAPDKYSSDGILYIEDESNVIEESRGFDILIRSLDDYFLSYHVENVQSEANNTFSISNPFSKGLETGKQYIVDVYGYAETGQQNEVKLTYIGSCSFNTKQYAPITVNLSLTSTVNSSMISTAKFMTSAVNETSQQEYESIMNYHMYMMTLALSITEPTSSVASQTLKRNIYYHDDKWYLDDTYNNELTKNQSNEYIIEIGPGGFFDIDENMLKGKKVYLEILDDVAYDKTYISEGWQGEFSSEKELYKINGLPDFIAKKKGTNVNTNPYKNYQNTIGVEYTRVEIILGLRLPELIIDGPALQVDPILNINATDYGVEYDSKLEEDTVIGFYVRDLIHDPHHVFTSKSFYMFETKDFNDFVLESDAKTFESDLETTKTKIMTDTELKFNIKEEYFELQTNYRAYDPITSGLAFENDTTGKKDLAHIVDLKAKATINQDQNPNTRSGVVFLLKEGSGKVYQNKVGDIIYNVVNTNNTRGFSYTFAFTSEVNIDKFNPQPLKTYPYNHSSYDGYKSLQRSNPCFAPRQKPVIHVMPYEVSKDRKELFAKYFIYDKDGSCYLNVNENKECLIYDRVTNEKLVNNTIFNVSNFNNIKEDVLDTSISKTSLKVSTQHYLDANLDYNDLIIPFKENNHLFIETYNFDPDTYGFEEGLDFGNIYGTKRKLVVEGMVGRVNLDVFKYKLSSKDDITRVKVDNVTAKFEDNKLITTIPLIKSEYNQKIALVELILTDKDDNSYSYFEPLNQKGELNSTGDYTFDDVTHTLTIKSFASKFTKFSENDKVKIKVRIYFHTDLIGYSYLAGSSKGTNTKLDTNFGIVKNGLDGTIASYHAPIKSSTRNMIDKNVNSEFSGTKSFFRSNDSSQTVIDKLFKLEVKNSQNVKIFNDVNEKDYNINFNYIAGEELYMPEKLKVEEKEIIEELTFPKLPIVVDLVDDRKAATEYELTFDVSQFKSGDSIEVKVFKREDGLIEVPNIGGEGVNSIIIPLNTEDKVKQVLVKLQNLKPSTAYLVELSSHADNTKQVVKLRDNSQANYQILTLTATGIVSFSAKYHALSYNNKYLDINLNVEDYPSINNDQVSFVVKDKLGKIIFGDVNNKITINKDNIKFNLDVFDSHTKTGLSYDEDYIVYANIYNKDGGLVKSETTPLKIKQDEIVIRPMLRQAYDVDKNMHIIHTKKIPVKDNMRMIYQDGMCLEIKNLQGQVLANDYYTDLSKNKTTVNNNGFNTSSDAINLKLDPSTTYEITYTVIVDKFNNGKDKDGNHLPTINEYMENKEAYPNAHQFVKVFNQQIKTLDQANHDFGQINYSVSQNNIYIKFINTNNVYKKLSRIEYRIDYLDSDTPKGVTNIIDMTINGEANPDKYLTIPGYTNDTFDILLEGFQIPDINLEYNVSMTMSYIGEVNSTEIKMKVIAAEAAKN